MIAAIRLAWLGLVALTLVAEQATAGGLYIQEWGTPSQGMANGGANAVAETAATAFHNPAGMTRLDDHGAVLAAGFLIADVEFDQSSTPPPSGIGGGDGGQQGGPGPVLSAHYVHRIWDREDADWFDRFRLGVSLISLSGAVLDPHNDWAGRSQVTELSLFTLSVIPSVAVRLHETFSIGVGANLMYGRMDYKIRPNNALNPDLQVNFDWIDDFEAAPTVSALWEPRNDTRVGMIWADELELGLSGSVKIKNTMAGDPSVGIKTKIPFVQSVHTSVVHEFTEDLFVGAQLRWEDWSEFGTQFVALGGQDTPGLKRNWKDTWGGSLGIRYRIDERWAVLTGFGYDSTPVRNKDRTADMPMDRQWRLAIGAQRTLGKKTAGLNFSYANLGEAKIRQDDLRGSYDDNQLFSVTLYLTFDSLPWGMQN